ncbi:helix-turn-helix transcriptional regulator [Rhabdobacter roseus]|uniref:AraC-like DNA-binding protein n=1 Tax=Rhabdobacter roseus TaxID=1655419 RepID=A0A840TWS8_9BACT|nr:helix-turn-helix domain-containing protein [Rhabdobacter roseus]MBB5284099.1 AraC-like DNA-binding protein [Rhabdobacter roseus]
MSVKVKNKLSHEELFRIKPMKPVIKTTSPHGHKDYLEIIFLEEGAGYHQIDFNRYEVRPQSLYLILPGQVHCWELTQVPKGVVLMVHKDFLLESTLYDPLFTHFPCAYQGYYATDSLREELAQVLERITNEYEQQRPHHQAVIQSYLQILFTLLKRLEGEPSTTATPGVIKSFFQLVEEHFKTRREVAEYAALLHITPKTLSATCKKYLGQTAGEIIAGRLTQEAKKLLLYSEFSLTEIAYELQFSDPSHFNKFFVRQTGVTPLQYRKGIS